MLKFNANTPIQFYAKSDTYVVGEGQNGSWTKIESIIKVATEEDLAVTVSTYFCEWQGSYGDRAMSAEALGVKDSARIRTFFNPDIYNKLRSEQVVIIKNADSTGIVDGVPDKTNPNVYELWGGVDDVLLENQFMEFKVRRYEGI